jgi:hypothetical protein
MSPLNGCIHGPRLFATQHYALERLKALSQDAGVTINDVEQPAPRLQRIAASTRHANSALGRLPRGDAMNTYAMLLKAPYMTQLAVGLGGRTTPMQNVVVSKVPGPRQPPYIEGARVDQLYPLSVLFNGQALNVTVSYDGTMCIGFTGCRDSLPGMQRIAVFSGDALEELERAVCAGVERLTAGLARGHAAPVGTIAGWRCCPGATIQTRVVAERAS